ncbi:hypothetical protein EIW28_22150 [Glycomyces terrestris]|uniref:Uncharacterized protein n=1 Tax=Glycomyces terrestris TaxID=2493553 RepID=A0A426UT37_9ACTN|nr:hypothetical protein EIW28_22150 [Glycomyces terrestris]
MTRPRSSVSPQGECGDRPVVRFAARVHSLTSCRRGRDAPIPRRARCTLRPRSPRPRARI